MNFLSVRQTGDLHSVSSLKEGLQKASYILIATAFVMTLIAVLGCLCAFLSPVGCVCLVMGAAVLLALAVSAVLFSLKLSKKLSGLIEESTKGLRKEHSNLISATEKEMEADRFDFEQSQIRGTAGSSETHRIAPLFSKEREALVKLFGKNNPLISLIKQGKSLPRRKAIKFCIVKQLIPLLTDTSVLFGTRELKLFLNWFKDLLTYPPGSILKFLFEMKLDDFPEIKEIFPGKSGSEVVSILCFFIAKFIEKEPRILESTLEIYSDSIKEVMALSNSSLTPGFSSLLKVLLLEYLPIILEVLNFYVVGGLSARESEQMKLLVSSEFMKIKSSLGNESSNVEEFVLWCLERKLFLPLILMRFHNENYFKTFCSLGIERIRTLQDELINLEDPGNRLEEGYQSLLRIVGELGKIKTDSFIQKTMMVSKIKVLEKVLKNLGAFVGVNQEAANPILYLAILATQPPLQEFLRGFLQFSSQDTPIIAQGISRLLKGFIEVRAHNTTLKTNLQFLSQKLGVSEQELHNSIALGDFVPRWLSKIFKK